MCRPGRNLGLGLAASVLAMLAAAPRTARATDILVDCGAGETISAALSSLDDVGPNTITVSGTCHESVVVFSRDRLELFGVGATIVGTADLPVANVSGSRNIVISGFTLTGGSVGLRVARASEVAVDNLQSHGNATGISVQDGSLLRLNGAVNVHGNTGNGIVGAASRIVLSDGAGSNSIADNGGDGVVLADGSKGNFLGVTTIHGNGAGGVSIVRTSSINLFGAVVDSNGGTGVNVQETSHCQLGSNTISNNGAAASGGGIRVADNSDLYLDGGVSVTGNTGIGVQAELAGQLSSVGGNTITGNTLEGVRVRRMGLAHFYAPDVITGQGGTALTCDSTSLVVGDLTGVSKVKCSNVEKEVGAPAPTVSSRLRTVRPLESPNRAGRR